MIQRVQSLYLLIAIVVAIVTLFVPLMSVVNTEGVRLVTFTGIACDTALPEMAGHHPWSISLFSFLSILCPIVSMFLFKHRKKQVVWADLTVVSNALCLLAIAYTGFEANDILQGSINPELCSLLPLVSIVAAIMARKGIRHDEALVRAADRIR